MQRQFLIIIQKKSININISWELVKSLIISKNKTNTLKYLFFIFTQLTINMEANGINYYKGVLLCSRPNESPSTSKKKQFCGRVFPNEQLGLVPVKLFDQRKTRKRVLPVLNNHKKWLEQFKKQVHDQKEQDQKEKEKAVERLEKIKQEAIQQRQKAKNSLTQIKNQDEQIKITKKQDTTNQGNYKKKDKPAWAKTAQQNEENEQKQVEQLIDFFNTDQQNELKDYLTDDSIKGILTDLKSKIEKLKEQNDWKNNQMKKIQDNKQRYEQERQRNKDDVLSRISRQSGAQSVASQKTAERVEQLEKKKKQVQWDKLSGVQKKTGASVDQQIAKNIADEVLRNYPALKHHSNTSIRQLIEKHAQAQIKQ